MPEISRFFGIVVSMYYHDHPPPHFHVRYGSQKALVSIEDLTVLKGRISPRVRDLVTQWATAHKMELEQNWERSERNALLARIEPLE